MSSLTRSPQVIWVVEELVDIGEWWCWETCSSRVRARAVADQVRRDLGKRVRVVAYDRRRR